MCGGRSQPMPKPLTRAEMEAATDNPFENPNSGVTAPSWKPDEVKKEKAEIAAEEAAAKAAAARVSSTEVVPRSSGKAGVVSSKAKREANQAKAKKNYQQRKFKSYQKNKSKVSAKNTA